MSAEHRQLGEFPGEFVILKLSRPSPSPTGTLGSDLGMQEKALLARTGLVVMYPSFPPFSSLDHQPPCSFCRADLQDHVSGCN